MVVLAPPTRLRLGAMSLQPRRVVALLLLLLLDQRPGRATRSRVALVLVALLECSGFFLGTIAAAVWRTQE